MFGARAGPAVYTICNMREQTHPAKISMRHRQLDLRRPLYLGRRLKVAVALREEWKGGEGEGGGEGEARKERKARMKGERNARVVFFFFFLVFFAAENGYRYFRNYLSRLCNSPLLQTARTIVD